MQYIFTHSTTVMGKEATFLNATKCLRHNNIAINMEISKYAFLSTDSDSVQTGQHEHSKG